MLHTIKLDILDKAHQLSRLLLGVLFAVCLLSTPSMAQTTPSISVEQQRDKRTAELKEFLDSLAEIQTSPDARYSARWLQPINIYVNLPQDPELQRQLITQLYRLNDEVPGLPVITVHSKFSAPEKANFVIESASEKDIQQKSGMRGIKFSTDQCALNLNFETRGISSAQINNAFLMTRESLSRDTSLQCLLKLVMIGLGIGDPDGNSILLFNATFNSYNKTENGYGAGDIALLRYAYAAKTTQYPKAMPPDEKLAGSFWAAPHMAQRALPIYQDVKALIQKLYASPESRGASFQKLATLLGKPSALGYLSFVPMMTDKDFEIFQETIRNVDETDLNLLLQQCSSCFFTLLANSIESVFAQGRQRDAKKLITTMIAADKQGNSPVQRFLVLYYQSLLEWDVPGSEKKLQEAISLVKTYHGIRSQTFLNFQTNLTVWYAQHGDLEKAVKEMDDTEALYDTTILPPVKEGRQLMKRAEIYQKADNKTKARQNLAQARKRIESFGNDEDLVRLNSIEKSLADN